MPRRDPLPPDRLIPHPDRLSAGSPRYDDILKAHQDAIASGRDLYRDPLTGLLVMTARFLWDRGSCCDTGCRHCPWVDRPRGPDAA
jgi:hypothetical protein